MDAGAVGVERCNREGANVVHHCEVNNVHHAGADPDVEMLCGGLATWRESGTSWRWEIDSNAWNSLNRAAMMPSGLAH